ncbi:MAG TPA: hypothetical protein VJN18_35785 [Polyangiaceae bacterium]|nr:hypothetical protein [Polyangiaceae bacterium]
MNTHQSPCPSCVGSGHSDDPSSPTCSRCGGSGSVKSAGFQLATGETAEQAIERHIAAIDAELAKYTPDYLKKRREEAKRLRRALEMLRK